MTALFTEENGSVRVPLRRLPNARLLWINEREARTDPAFFKLGQDMLAYEKHILTTCAYLLDDGTVNELEFSDVSCNGYADRYGGYGIGNNGGSGRAAHVNGYLVKGIGRTPLVSRITDFAHGTGGAYLEEAVRETIFAEIASLEFPHSGISTLALIDTGLLQTWDSEPSIERRVLLVRLPFVRPAHFQRALGFVTDNPKEGAENAEHVRNFFDAYLGQVGPEGFLENYVEFWRRWAEQLAYAFVHRLPHGSNTISNIALDGRVLDFGAMSAVPHWGNVATTLSWQPFRLIFPTLENALRQSIFFIKRYQPTMATRLGSEAEIRNQARRRFDQTIVREVLRLCGIDVGVITSTLSPTRVDHFYRRIEEVLNTLQKERFDLLQQGFGGDGPDFPKIWERSVLMVFEALRAEISANTNGEDPSIYKARAKNLVISRPRHHREHLRKELYRLVDYSSQGIAPRRRDVEATIDEMVVSGRRDTRLVLSPSERICGFFYSRGVSLVLLADLDQRKTYMSKESNAPDPAWRVRREEITRWSDNSIEGTESSHQGKLYLFEDPGYLTPVGN